ncbi:hypothetical protein AAG570_012970, partial [Ranatra chinensis]
ALEVNLVNFLLKLLEEPLGGIENAERTTALIVRTLKSMSSVVTYSAIINGILEKSVVWPSYRDQNHDLFITNSPVAACITVGVPASAGYLTHGEVKTLPTVPPPLQDEDT